MIDRDYTTSDSVPATTPGLQEIVRSRYPKMQIFHQLEDREIEQLLPCFELNHYPAQTPVFREGDNGDYIGFVLTGRLKVIKATPFPDHHVVLATVGQNSFVGEFSMLDGERRTATVITLEPSELLLLHRPPLERLFSDHPRTGVKILKGINRIVQLRLQKLSERLVAMY